jgi:hypothetical protein
VPLLLKLGFILFGVTPDSIWYEIKVVEDSKMPLPKEQIALMF